MNSVSLVGTLEAAPELRESYAGRVECRMRLAVPRCSRDGRQEPGVVYVDVTTFGDEAEECAARLSRGSRIGLSGRLESDEPQWSGVLIDQLDFF